MAEGQTHKSMEQNKESIDKTTQMYLTDFLTKVQKQVNKRGIAFLIDETGAIVPPWAKMLKVNL